MKQRLMMAMMVSGGLLMSVGEMARGQGSLTPPGAPAADMRTLQQAEPRTPISYAPYTIKDPGSYYLTTNLVTTRNGIVVDADDASLDLNGFALIGNGGITNVGIYIRGYSNAPLRGVSVRNGSVQNFGIGVQFRYIQDSRMEEVSVSGCSSNGIMFFGQNRRCDGNMLLNCSSIGNAGHGICLEGSITGSCSGITISRCTVSENGNRGIYLNAQVGGQCNGNQMLDCVIGTNRYNGIQLEGYQGQCNGNQMLRCTIVGSGSRGVQLTGDDGACVGNMVKDCIINDSGSYGFYLTGQVGGKCNGNRITRCTINGSGSYGIYLYGVGGDCSGNVISECTLFGNQNRGIISTSGQANRLENNHVAGVFGSTSYGISMTGSNNNLVVRNTCVGQTNNFSIAASHVFGPIVTNTGELASTGDAAHPWANFSR